MNPNSLRMAVSAGLFLCIFVFGFWLSRAGKPYNGIIFTIHKLLALGAVIYLAATVYQVQQLATFNPAQVLCTALTAVCFLALFVSGALLSLDKAMPPVVLRLHQAAPYLAVLSTLGGLAFLFP